MSLRDPNAVTELQMLLACGLQPVMQMCWLTDAAMGSNSSAVCPDHADMGQMGLRYW